MAASLREYLLGQVSEAERLTLEERLMADDDTYEELLIVEDELTDEYLRGQLSQTERKHFEEHFLAPPSRQEKLRFAKVIRTHLAAHAPAKSPSDNPRGFKFLPFRNPVLSYSVGIAAVLLVIAVSWLALRPIFWNAGDPQSTVTLTLTPGLTRSGSTANSVRIPADVERVRVQLVLAEEGSYNSYTAVFQSIDGRTIAEERATSSESVNAQRVVVVVLSSTLLPPGEYQIKLNGASTANEVVHLASYSLKVLNP